MWFVRRRKDCEEWIILWLQTKNVPSKNMFKYNRYCVFVASDKWDDHFQKVQIQFSPNIDTSDTLVPEQYDFHCLFSLVLCLPGLHWRLFSKKILATAKKKDCCTSVVTFSFLFKSPLGLSSVKWSSTRRMNAIVQSWQAQMPVIAKRKTRKLISWSAVRSARPKGFKRQDWD